MNVHRCRLAPRGREQIVRGVGSERRDAEAVAEAPAASAAADPIQEVG